MLWVSVSNDLRFDAIRDLDDIGARHIRVWPEVKDLVNIHTLPFTDDHTFCT